MDTTSGIVFEPNNTTVGHRSSRGCTSKTELFFPRGSTYTTIMELGPKSHNGMVFWDLIPK